MRTVGRCQLLAEIGRRYLARASLLLKQGHPGEALRQPQAGLGDFIRAIELDPSHATAFFSMANLQ